MPRENSKQNDDQLMGWRAQLVLPKSAKVRKFLEYTSSGTPVSITGGKLGRDSIQIYKRGQCFALAAALTEAQVGVPVLAQFKGTNYSAHALVCLPNGQLLDIEGLHELSKLDTQYQYVTQEPGSFVRQVWQNEDWARMADPQNRAMAESFVEPLLKYAHLI